MRKSCSVLAAVALSVTGLALPSSASAACAPEQVGTTTVNEAQDFALQTPVVVGAQVPVQSGVRVYFLNNGCSMPTDVSVDLFHQLDPTAKYHVVLGFGATYENYTVYRGSTTWDPRPMTNAGYQGNWSITTTVAGTVTPGSGYFQVSRATTLTADATPEPASKGETIRINGVLRRASWDTGTYRRYTRQPVDLQFRGTIGGYNRVKTVSTGTNGEPRASAKVATSGFWRFAFAGNNISAPVRAVGDRVVVAPPPAIDQRPDPVRLTR